MKTVLYINNSPLFLSHIERNASGGITKARVINGAWTLRIVGDEMQAKSGNTIVTRQNIESLEEVKVVTRSDDYEHVISKANKLRAGK